MPQEGLHEQLINRLLLSELNDLDPERFYIQEKGIDKKESGNVLTQYLVDVIKLALDQFSGDDMVTKQIKLINKVIFLLQTELKDDELNQNLIELKGKILTAIFRKADARFSDFETYLKEITHLQDYHKVNYLPEIMQAFRLKARSKKKYYHPIKSIFLFHLSNGQE